MITTAKGIIEEIEWRIKDLYANVNYYADELRALPTPNYYKEQMQMWRDRGYVEKWDKTLKEYEETEEKRKNLSHFYSLDYTRLDCLERLLATIKERENVVDKS